MNRWLGLAICIVLYIIILALFTLMFINLGVGS